MRFSLEGKVALLTAACGCAGVGIALLLQQLIGNLWISVFLTLLIILPGAIFVSRRFARRLRRTLTAVSDGISGMRDNDFSVSVAGYRADELGELVRAYNGLGDVLREERQGLLQRELLLDTVIQATPLSMVLTNATGRVVYSNVAARQTFLVGRKLEGLDFKELVAATPEPLQ